MQSTKRWWIWILAALLAAAGVAPASAASTDWYRWRGPDFSGVSKEKAWTTAWPKEGPGVLWKAAVGTGYSSVAVADGRAFTMGNVGDRDTVYCFDATTGADVWKYAYACALDPRYYDGGPSATPTVDGGHVYTLSRQGHLFCFEAANGRVIWQRNINDLLALKTIKTETPEWGYAGSPLVQGSQLILNVGAAGVALDKADGKVLWTSDRQASGYATPVPFKAGRDSGLLLFGAKAVIALAPKDGAKLWEFPWETEYDVNAADPIVVGNKVFISSGYGRGCALLQFNGRQVAKVWENKSMRNQLNACVLLAGHLYGFDGDHGGKTSALRCVEFETGKLKWSEPIRPGALMAADGKLIILAENGELLIARAAPAAFTPLARAQILGGKCWTVPVLNGGRIYGRNSRGDLVCVSVQGRPVAALPGR